MLSGDNKDLIRIVNNAIPLRECPLKKREDILRRVYLMEEIKKYVSKQLSSQFNAKEVA